MNTRCGGMAVQGPRFPNNYKSFKFKEYQRQGLKSML